MTVQNDDNQGLDPFDLAFGEALQGLTETPKEEDPKVDEPAAEDPPKAEEPREEPKAEDPPKAEESKEEPAAPNPLEAELAKLKAENEKLKAQPPAPAAAAPTDAEKAQEAERVKAQEKSVAEWETFKKDWAEPAAMMEKMYAGIMASVPQMIQAAIKEAIAPIQQQTALTAEDRFKQVITAKHSDAFEVIGSGAVDKWIETLPSFQRAAATAVLEKGSAEEVVELLDLYRGTTPAAPAPQKTAEELAAEAKVDQEKQRKLNALKAVPDKRSTSTGQPDPNDFDGAFKQAVASGL